MWPADRIIALGAVALLSGTAIGAVVAFVIVTAEQLSLPAGPSFAIALTVVPVGAVLGAVLSLAAAAGAASTVLLTRHRPMRLTTRAVLAGAVAGMAVAGLSSYLFLRAGVIDGEILLLSCSLGAALLAATGTALTERQELAKSRLRRRSASASAATSGVGALPPR
jgi:hypothetical protein